jgi:hypothetical protein
VTDTEEEEIMQAYVNFIAKFGKLESSKTQTNDKYKTFKANYLHIKKHNKNGYEEELPFVMDVNQFADVSAEDFEKMQGVLIPKVLVQQTELKTKSHHYWYHHHHHKD